MRWAYLVGARRQLRAPEREGAAGPHPRRRAARRWRRGLAATAAPSSREDGLGREDEEEAEVEEMEEEGLRRRAPLGRRRRPCSHREDEGERLTGERGKELERRS